MLVNLFINSLGMSMEKVLKHPEILELVGWLLPLFSRTCDPGGKVFKITWDPLPLLRAAAIC